MRRLRWLPPLVLLAGCASIALAPPDAASPGPVSIRALLTTPSSYDRQHVLVQGQVAEIVRGRTLEGGRRVTIFTLVASDGVRIRAMTWGFPLLFEGTLVELHGIFLAEFQIDEREQQGIIEIKEIRPLL